jgi:hypothetical protein
MDQLQYSAFTRSTFTYDTKDLITMNIKGDVVTGDNRATMGTDVGFGFWPCCINALRAAVTEYFA